jgi:hypothetical protein
MEIMQLGHGAFRVTIMAWDALPRSNDRDPHWLVVPVHGQLDALALIGWPSDQVCLAGIRDALARLGVVGDVTRLSDHAVNERFASLLADGTLIAVHPGPGAAGAWSDAAGQGFARQALAVAGAAPAPSIRRGGDARGPSKADDKPGAAIRPRASAAASSGAAPSGIGSRVPAVVTEPDRQHALLCVVVDEEGVGIEGVSVQVALGRQSLLGCTDHDGAVVFDRLPPGAYTMCLDLLDQHAWEPILTAPLGEALLASMNRRVSGFVTDRLEATNRAFDHNVLDGECVATIAYQTGFFWSTLWEDPGNEALRRTRGSPYLLAAKDRVHVPKRQLRRHPCAVDSAVVIRRLGVPERLRIQFLYHNYAPRPFVKYSLSLRYRSGVTRQLDGVTDAAGYIDERVYPEIVEATIELFEGDTVEQHHLALADLNPVSEISGWKQRLNRLGYDCDSSTGIDPQTRAALRNFQRDNHLPVTGSFTLPTRSQLLKVAIT